ncbi:MAG: PqqD family protein [Pirellulaceae bacterium]|nr:PqqD family protein [Pirellulaceae bacterium]
MSDSARYRLNEPQVIGEVLEGELVLVHFASGCYYSLRETGADVCNLLLAGCSIGETAAALADHHALPVDRMLADTRAFVGQLLAEQLLIATTPADAADGNVGPVAAAYSPPKLEKYDDMADQLLLDPIHEIDQSGWPIRDAA